MDVERIQKVNNLAVDLMKQGLAQNREDAMAQAEKIFSGYKDAEEYSSIKERLDQKPQEEVKVQEELSQDKIRDILEQNTKFIVRKFGEFQEKMDSMKKEIEDLRVKFTYNKIPTVKEILTEAKEAKESSEQQPPEEAKEDPTKNHPRSGNYKDTDVSIEKFFYMGSK